MIGINWFLDLVIGKKKRLRSIEARLDKELEFEEIRNRIDDKQQKLQKLRDSRRRNREDV